jgi:cytochrome P450
MTTLPGPARTPLVGSLLEFRRDRLGLFTRLAHTHGDAVRFFLGPQQVVLLSHPNHVHDVLVAGAGDFAKGPILRRAKVLLGEGLLTSEGAVHRRQRRLVQPAFTTRRVAGYTTAMVAAAERAAGAWSDGRAVDAHATMLQITVEAAGAALFSADVGHRAAGVAAAVDDVLAAYNLLFLPLSGLVQRLPLPAVRRLRRGSGWLDAFVERLIAERRAHAGAHDDVLGLLLAAGMDDRQVRDEVLTLLLAGHETTASALTWALHLLAGNPIAQQRLHEEVDAVAGAGPLDGAHIDRLPWTRGVLAESLRLYPPSWAMGREALRDHEIDGLRIGAGTPVVLSQWVIHRDGRWWPEPERFAPERWLEPDRARPREAYFPFGAGGRRCIGEAFAWAEGILVLATLARRWRVEPAPGHAAAPDPLLTLRPRDAWVVPRRR